VELCDLEGRSCKVVVELCGRKEMGKRSSVTKEKWGSEVVKHVMQCDREELRHISCKVREQLAQGAARQASCVASNQQGSGVVWK
jgi:hypothetical protein